MNKKKQKHATATSSEADISDQQPKISDNPLKIISWLCLEDSDYVGITREDQRVDKVSIDTILIMLYNDELRQMLSTENRVERSKRNLEY
jgi:hypothetical protein